MTREEILKKGREDRNAKIDKEFNDMIGTTINDFTILSHAPRDKNKRRRFNVRCKCGKEYSLDASLVKRGVSKRCASCAQRLLKGFVHGYRKDGKREQLYVKWVNMRMSCYSPNYKDYPKCGGLGIIICQQWQTYQGFRKWALANKYRDGLVLMRDDKSLNFEPSNCFFAPTRHQRYEFKGKMLTISELRKITGSRISLKTILHRLDRSWPILDAFLQPVGTKVKKKRNNESIIKTQSCNMAF